MDQQVQLSWMDVCCQGSLGLLEMSTTQCAALCQALFWQMELVEGKDSPYLKSSQSSATKRENSWIVALCFWSQFLPIFAKGEWLLSLTVASVC